MLVSRMAKNLYVWHGRSRLPQTLQELHQAGREQGYHLQMDQREGSSPYAAYHMQNTHGMTHTHTYSSKSIWFAFIKSMHTKKGNV